jgi:hypothetical protein
MLTCRKCGAQMSGVDIVCKHCGTPWGKKGKSKLGLFLTIFFIFAISAGILYYTNPSLIMGLFKSGFQNKPLEETPPQDTANLPTPEQNITVPQPEPQPEEPKTEPILPPVFTVASASSSLAPEGVFSYTPDMTLDNKNSTAWLEGSPNNGINEWIQFSNTTEQYVSKMKIFNGYQKNNVTYINNGRLKKIKNEFSDGTSTE